ncbi:MAG TPA: hypothetical protein VEH06_13770 [Candidatus Bathyarchaeia archaeon]|nr:hypothetical protein [Candidatus Bathyarchaeia archaeon]
MGGGLPGEPGVVGVAVIAMNLQNRTVEMSKDAFFIYSSASQPSNLNPEQQ